MGILRADRITGIGGANAITGSVRFHGNQDDLQLLPSADFDFGTGDYTIEAWVYPLEFGRSQMIFAVHNADSTAAAGKFYFRSTNKFTYWSENMARITSSTTYTESKWYHVALVNNSGTQTIYVDGTSQGTSAYGNGFGNTTFVVHIGRNAANDNQSMNGYISNIRVTKGTALYTSAFTPPTTRLIKRSDTVLLACNSASNVLNEETGKVIQSVRASTNNSGAKASKFTPNSPVVGTTSGFSTTTDVGSQYGSTFDGFGSFASSTYMVPPGGNTRERNRGRGLIGQGSNTTSPSNVKAISFIEIQSGGTAFDFGDSTNGSMYAMTAVSSSTRAVFAGGHTSQSSPYPTTNLMEFVTISTTAKCIDFGDLNIGAANRVGASNQTRGLIAAGYSPNTRNIDKIEIATAGDATDYGDLTDQGFYGLNSGGMVSSTTRGLFAGGSGNSAPVAVNTITFSLFSSSGNSTDFGDLTHTNAYFNTGNSNGTRGIFMGGSDIDSPYPATDQIDYVTIASAGNAQDFGSLNTSRYVAMGASNSTRGVIAGGRINPAPSLPATNHMEYVTISTTGNGLDFGELIEPERSGAGCSDSHGGL